MKCVPTRLLTSTVAIVLLGAMATCAMSADWLGECINGTGTGTIKKTEVQGQVCDPSTLTDCSHPASNCEHTASSQPCFGGVTIVVPCYKNRTIQYGDCITSVATDECKECKNSTLICFVKYWYRRDDCADMCDKPTLHYTAPGDKCKP